MSTELTKDNIVKELKKPGTLMDLLNPEQFAEENQVAYRLAQEYVGKKEEFKVTQLRKVFHALKEKERLLKGKDDEDLEPDIKVAIRLLIPELAYAQGRKLIPYEFYELMQLCLSSEKLQKVGDLRVLMQFLTALLAYYKFHEKRKEGRK